MSVTKLPLKATHLTLYIEDGQGLVFHSINHQLYHLPTVSVAILLSIDSGDNQQITLSNLANECQLPIQQLAPIYHEIKGLFSLQTKQTTYLDGRYSEFSVSAKQKDISDNTKVAYVKIAETVFSIDTTDKDLFRAIITLLSPSQCPQQQPHFVLTIVKTNNEYQLYSNEILVETELRFKQVMPLLIDRLQILSFQKSDYTFCFHGAALTTPQGTLLLPGKSGSGKSTLSAVLAAKNAYLFSDEIIAFNKNFKLCSLSLPMAVKSGSWDSLHIHYPNIEDMPIWHRLDGRSLKYIWPKVPQLQCKTTKDNTNKFLLINPIYLNKGPAHSIVQKLSVFDTITILTKSGYQLGFELNKSGFEAFLNFISRLPSYQLSYTNSQQALDSLERLWQLH